MSDAAHPEREIEEDVMNVPLVAWLGVVSAILIAVSVIVLTGVYYMTKKQQMAERRADADERISSMEAQREIDALMVDGYFQFPDVEDAEGNKTRGKVNVPVELGMQEVVEQYK